MAQRVQVLDSMRGIAALQVVFHHYLIVFPMFFAANGAGDIPNPWIWLMTTTPFHFLWAGHEAVVFFFVLSGFVLALPFMDQETSPYGPYLIRRIFRIWLPYATAISAGVLLLNLNSSRHGIPGASSWFNDVWSRPVSGSDFIQLLLMIGNTNNVDSSTWSLVHEMRISIIFPLFAWLVSRLNWSVNFLMALGLVALSRLLYSFHPVPISQFNPTVFYTSFFVLGALMAKHRLEVKKWFSARKFPFKAAAAVTALILYNWKWLIEPFNRFSVDLRSNVYSDSATALGAALFMALALGSAKSQKALERPGFQWLGKVSYSLYLIHPLVLMTCVYAFFGIFPLPLSVALALGLSLFFSEYFYRWVERPSMEWGRKLSETTGPALRRLING